MSNTMETDVPKLTKHFNLTAVVYHHKDPPRWLLYLGRKYWKGWFIKVRVHDRYGNTRSGQSARAPRSPNPQDVADATAFALQEALDKFPKI